MALRATVTDQRGPRATQGHRHSARRVYLGRGQRNALPPVSTAVLSNRQHGGSLLVVMKMKANWARLVVAIFTMAMFYASVCSASCAVGVCPEQRQRTGGHDCDHVPLHHSDSSRHQAPDKPDCSQHQHPALFVTKSCGDLPQFQMSVVDHLKAAAAAFSPAHALSAIFTSNVPSQHAPPPASVVPLYHRISALRI